MVGSDFPNTTQVSSEETRLRNESNEFTYDLGSARPYSTRGTVPPLGAAGAQYSPEGVPAVAPNDILSYRSGGSYNYAAKGYYGPVTWSPHGYEDGVDYGLQSVFPQYSTIYVPFSRGVFAVSRLTVVFLEH